MPFVLDTSIPVCWVFQDEQDPRAEAAYVRIKTEEALVPSLWWFEIRNILVVNERRKRITESDTGVSCETWQGCVSESIVSRRKAPSSDWRGPIACPSTMSRIWNWRSGRRYHSQPWTANLQPPLVGRGPD